MLFVTIVTVFFTKMPRCIVTGFAQTGLAKFKFDDFVFKGCTMCTNILRPFLFAHCTAIRRRPPIRLIARLFLDGRQFLYIARRCFDGNLILYIKALKFPRPIRTRMKFPRRACVFAFRLEVSR